MKYIIITFVALFAVLFKAQQETCESVSFTFSNTTWSLPSSVKEAVEKHRLKYKPPGFYYDLQQDSMEVIVDYHFETGDFDNEYQPKEILFPRVLHSYIFRFPEHPGVYDSLITTIEQTFNKKFILTKGLKVGRTLLESEKPFEYYFLTVSPCLTIGIASSPARKKKDRKVVVRFMYDLPLGRMGVIMGNYL
ncbi:hypothetical protein [Dyadobacter sp. CY356]|uniref:hypothetical protein n=1 Tax=Dyadobacter sp. CY356 TaxID=2906442 RepID=UPI001F1A904D|nr:hypothetical protein [Dyadobacter sp. CY356]